MNDRDTIVPEGPITIIPELFEIEIESSDLRFDSPPDTQQSSHTCDTTAFGNAYLRDIFTRRKGLSRTEEIARLYEVEELLTSRAINETCMNCMGRLFKLAEAVGYQRCLLSEQETTVAVDYAKKRTSTLQEIGITNL
jgi:uncharacterized protein YihD (DUF1040 family)